MPPETETAVIQETPASLTSHLQGVVLAEAGESGEVKDASESVASLGLPRTLKGSLAFLAEVQARQPNDSREADAKQALLTRISGHLHTLSQGPTSPPITVSGHKALAGASSDHAEDIHLTLLCRSDRVVAKRLEENAATIARLKKQIAELTAKPSK
jgi:hypothetical protein